MKLILNKKRKMTLVTVLTSLLLLALIAVFIIPNGIAPNIVGSNHKNVTVWTHVNISNSKPEVVNITVHEGNTTATLRNVTLFAGYTKKIYCNATVRDYNGFNDIVYANASLWYNLTSSYGSADDNNTHYTNASCTFNVSSSNMYIGWYVCVFDVLYYSNNGTWTCNLTVMDQANKIGWNTNFTSFLPLYALNVTDGIDYGNVAVEDNSSDVAANITNLGNMGINITVEGYGARRGDGLAMNCSLNGNISVDNERFALNDTTPWTTKTQLVSTAGGVLIPDLTMPKQTDPATQIINTTYWQIYVPPNPAGNCTGYIIFTAMAP